MPKHEAALEPTYDADDWFAMGAPAFRAGQPLDLCLGSGIIDWTQHCPAKPLEKLHAV
jgi:hypothetical protein